MRRTQHKSGIVEGLLRQQSQGLRFDFQDFLPLELGNGDVLFGEQIIFCVVMGKREGVLVDKRFV